MRQAESAKIPAPDLTPSRPADRRTPAVPDDGTAAVVLSGRYEVGRLLGSGGVSSVHAARDLLLGREVAVKLFRRDTIAGPDLRLQQIEARLGAALNHYALTTLFDAGVHAPVESQPEIYLVMESIRGETLRERLRRGPLTVAQACWLGFDLAEALQYMHQAGFLHRDVKPANVLMADTGSVRPVVTKLTDFGIATPIGQPDLSEYTVGTAAYLSPEQVEGQDARPESDMYSLGLVLLEAITGTVAFPGTVEQSAFERLDRDPAIPAHIPSPVADLLARMTRKAPGDRVDLRQAAIELQQCVVDDLIQRRTTTTPALDTATTGALAPAEPVIAASAGATDATLSTLTRLAASAIATPGALLVLEDAGTASIAAQHGRPLQAGTAALPSDLFAGGRTTPWVIRDAFGEPSVSASPLFTGRDGIRAALGVPLLSYDRRRLGWLLLLDTDPRVFADTEITVAADFAGLAAHELELRATARRAMFADT